MGDISAALSKAVSLIWSLDPDLVEIIFLSFKVSFLAVGCAVVIGMPLGAALAVFRFPGRRGATILLNAMMGLPPGVVGLIVYLALSRAGPLGVFGLLFTPTAMVIAQTILVTPIVAALTRQLTFTLWTEYEEQLRSLGTGGLETVTTLL